MPTIPAIKNAAYTFDVSVTSQANPLLLQVNPTLAAGDVKVVVDGVALGNITALPTVTPAGGIEIAVALTAAEMNGDKISVQFIDVAGSEWCSLNYLIYPQARSITDLAFPVVSGRGFDVTTTGGVGIDWSNVENPTTVLNLSGTTLKTATDIATQIAALNNLSSAQATTAALAALTTQIADSVAADGSRPTYAQGILMILRFLTEAGVVGLIVTVNKEDGVTPCMSFTINDASNPTTITRAT